MSTSDYFARIAGSINLRLLQSRRVVVVGVGTVGSQIANELARCGVGSLCLIDHDKLETANLARHTLPVEFVGWNKAEALTVHLAAQVAGLQIGAIPRKISHSVSDELLDQWLGEADLIVAATDDRGAQRQIGQRALALSIPAIFPALYGQDGGEVVIQLDPRFPCFHCWDAFRRNTAQLRGVTALNMTALPVIYTALRLSLGVLDTQSEHRRLMTTRPGEAPNQLFVHESPDAFRRAPLTRRPNCPSCAVGPAPHRWQAAEAWQGAESARTATTAPPAMVQPTAPPATPQPPIASHTSNVSGDLIASGLGVLVLWFFFTEGFNGFKMWWNPLAWIAVIGWLVYAASWHGDPKSGT